MKGSLDSDHIFYYNQKVSSIAHFCERKSHHIFSYNQQEVSGIAHFAVKGSLITSFNDQQEVSDVAHFVKSSLTTPLLTACK